MLTREEWTSGPGSPSVFWHTDGSRTGREDGTVLCGQSLGGRLGISLGRHATVFQAKIYIIMFFVHEIQINVRLEKYMSVCFDSQSALKALQAAKAMSSLVYPTTLWDSFGSPDILEYVEMRLPINLERKGSVYQFAELEPTLRTYWQNIKKKTNC
jgi:hypothetical protein